MGEVAENTVCDTLLAEEGEGRCGNHNGHRCNEEQAAAGLVDHQVEALLLVARPSTQEAEACIHTPR